MQLIFFFLLLATYMQLNEDLCDGRRSRLFIFLGPTVFLNKIIIKKNISYAIKNHSSLQSLRHIMANQQLCLAAF